MKHRREYGLVMPFVVCVSQGGTLDDESFVVGYELGMLSAELHYLESSPQGLKAIPASRFVHSVGVQQLDLIAMRHGYTVAVENADDEWSWVEFEIGSDNTDAN